MKTRIRQLISMLLCLAIAFAFCLGTSQTVKAQEPEGEIAEAITDDTGIGEVQLSKALKSMSSKTVRATDTDPGTVYVSEYATLTPVSVNKGSSAIYITPSTTSSGYTYTFNVNMPKAGTLLVSYYGSNGGSTYVHLDGNTPFSYTTADDGTQTRYAYATSGTHTLTFDFYKASGYSSGCVGFTLSYAPNTVNLITAPTGKLSATYYHGNKDNNSTVSKFKIKAKYNGYLDLRIGDANTTNYTINMKCTGFQAYDSVSSNNVRRYIGVQKGKTYTFTVKSYAPIYQIRVRMYKIVEGKYGTKKSTAATIKKGTLRRGLMKTNAKRVHWYKIVNPKLQKVWPKMTLHMSSGNTSAYSGGIKVTAYEKRNGKTKSMGTQTINASYKSTTLKLYTIGKGEKLVKGTYWLKVASYGGGNGYFTIKW